MRARFAAGFVAVWVVAALMGCASGGLHDRRAEFGKTYYIDGAGNWGFGVTTVGKGLKAAGYQGSYEAYIWTTSFNPAIDQVNRPAAHLRAAVLADKIRNYLKVYPDNDVNIIALSAGTGVAVWAVEALPPGTRISNMVLLGSSLSSTYDVSKAFRHMKGRIFVFYSSSDPILDGAVRLLGTIDGTFDDSAGLVGLAGAGCPAGSSISPGDLNMRIMAGQAATPTAPANRSSVGSSPPTSFPVGPAPPRLATARSPSGGPRRASRQSGGSREARYVPRRATAYG